MNTFADGDPIDAAIRSTSLPDLLAALRALSPAQRHERRAALLAVSAQMDAARWSTGARPTHEQFQLLQAALAVCGTAQDLARSWIGDELLVALCREFHPRALEGLADALLGHSPQHIRTVQALIAAGLAERPDTPAYSLGLIALPQVLRDAGRLQALLDADPGLAPALLRVFDVEGTADISLASSDKYTHVPDLAWGRILLGLVERGTTSTAVLLDRTLAALENDWPQYRSGWFSRFHAELAPDAAALRPHRARYLALCHSRIAPTVALALDVLARLDADAPLDGTALFAALRPVLASAAKSQVEAALKLVDRVVTREPARRTEAAALVAVGLVHESAPLQKAILRRLADWGVDAGLRGLLQRVGPGIAAVNRPAWQQLAGEGGPPVVPVPDAPAPDLPDLPGEAAVQPVDPLDPQRAIVPVADAGELVECIAHVFENDTDVDAFERALAGLVRLAPFDAAQRRLLAPVVKRAAKVRKPIAQALARLLLGVTEGRPLELRPGVDAGGNPSPVQDGLIRRIDALIALAGQGAGALPLAAPTHRRGFIAPAALVERVAVQQAKGVRNASIEQVLALLRLAPGAGGAVRAQARRLADDGFARALRYALGDAVEPGAEREPFAAAARIRHPGADDSALARRHGDLGPDAALAADYAWQVQAWESDGDERSITFHDLVVDAGAVPPDVPPERLAVLRHPPAAGARRHYRWWSYGGIDAGAIAYSATLLPSCPEAFCAEGARALGNNLDWWEAQWQNAAYLRLLLDPSCALGPMATLLLALGLLGKEPGQTAIAVDALVQARADGRLDAARLGDTLRRLFDTPLPKAARLCRSLQAAVRADTALRAPVFELLAAVLAAPADPPPRDVAMLLDLLLEQKLVLGRPLPAATRDAIAQGRFTGRAKAAQKALLAAA